MNITTEQGKTLKDAQGDVFRGLGEFQYSVTCLLIDLLWEGVKLNLLLWMSLIFLLLLFYVEVVEHACGMATLQMGEYVPNVSNGIDTYSLREPLGVCAGICPFNFPAMIPLWVNLIIFFSLLWLLLFIFPLNNIAFTAFVPHWIILNAICIS